MCVDIYNMEIESFELLVYRIRIADVFYLTVDLKSVKGKGVSFMENQAGWHGKAPNDEQYETAMADLEKVGEALCQK